MLYLVGAVYNFCSVHRSLGRAPAMAVGLVEGCWGMERGCSDIGARCRGKRAGVAGAVGHLMILHHIVHTYQSELETSNTKPETTLLPLLRQLGHAPVLNPFDNADVARTVDPQAVR